MQNGDIVVIAFAAQGRDDRHATVVLPSWLRRATSPVGASVPTDTGATVPGVTPDTSVTTDTTVAPGATTPDHHSMTRAAPTPHVRTRVSKP